MSAIVRVNDPQAPTRPPTLYLNPLPGHQCAAALRSAPTRDPLRCPRGRWTTRRWRSRSVRRASWSAPRGDDPQRPEIQRDDLLMLSLTDPDRATRIAMDTCDATSASCWCARQRSASASRSTPTSPQWRQLAQPKIAVVDRAPAPEFVPSIIVSDRPGDAPVVGAVGNGRSRWAALIAGPTPDIRFVQTSRSTVRITSGAYDFDVAIVAFRQEQAWTG